MIADVPRIKLLELVGRYGSGFSRDARRCKALLADVCGSQYRAECAVLVAAVDEGVTSELLGSSSGLPTEVLLGRLSDRLHANRGVADELACWSVETWAIALGVAADGNTLAKFKMDGLAPLIDLAGADGAISDAEANHLVAEAKTRGVGEADARAYLSAYAAARCWQMGRRQRTAAPSPPRPAPPLPQPVQPSPALRPSPDRTFRYALMGAALVAITVIVMIVHGKRQSQPTPQASIPPAAGAPVPAPSPSTSPDTQADREQRAYNTARGNAAALRVYANSCSICTYASAARSEIARLETADQEENIYEAAHSNNFKLQTYIDTCTICTHKAEARAEIAKLETAPPAQAPPQAIGGRYVKEGCGSIIDTQTGLEWYIGPDVTVSWGDAATWARQQPACGGGWTLPTMTQLKGLFDEAVSAGTGFYVNERYWPAHIDPVFAAIGSGSWVWADGSMENGAAPAINFNQGIAVRISPFGTPYTVRAFAVKTALAPTPQQGTTYAQGASDWRAYKAWSDAQTGDRRAGVSYWAANRNVRGHVACDEQAEEYSDNARARTLFQAGCQDAERRLDPIDARRNDPQYRAGFNDEAARSPLNP